jgi:branched-chain amino acid transport system permease protein
VLLVMFAPGGLASLLLLNLRVLKFRKFARLRDPYVGVFGGALTLLVGTTLIIEMTYHRSLNFAQGSTVRIAGFVLDTARPESWALALGTIACGLAIFEFARRRFKARWDEIAEEIEDWLRDNPEDA